MFFSINRPTNTRAGAVANDGIARKIGYSGSAVIVFAFLFVDLFDTVGTLIGVAQEGKLLNEKGELPRVGRALMADALGTCAGACLGTSTVTSYVESTTGVAEGGRTGLTAFRSEERSCRERV